MNIIRMQKPSGTPIPESTRKKSLQRNIHRKKVENPSAQVFALLSKRWGDILNNTFTVGKPGMVSQSLRSMRIYPREKVLLNVIGPGKSFSHIP